MHLTSFQLSVPHFTRVVKLRYTSLREIKFLRAKNFCVEISFTQKLRATFHAKVSLRETLA
ncbi:MAG: hypothetical protein DRR16_10315 [Candidatus Parabeggiatoa sp. nov. 3]|nr:MAG: hypothetical protein DRR00_11565 [Gammaproteobacteria bacterium]RKZ57601.1 MAG: hypothetical protein DRQ99_26720 [Gammaproteobacteria bacterium]RKZ86202.1 MAG: hypothetical protein DRR16_10315 [Gammaproteobacteria bacterium]